MLNAGERVIYDTRVVRNDATGVVDLEDGQGGRLNVVTATTDAGTGKPLLSAACADLLREANSYPRNRILQFGEKLIDVTISTGWTRAGAGSTFAASSEQSRRSSHTMKVDMTSSSADATLSWTNATGVLADPDDQLIAFDVYIPRIIQGITGSSASIQVFVSNAETYAAPATTWVFNSNFLRQGWNELRMCGKDADGSVGSYRGTGTLPYGVNKAGATGGTNPLVWTNPIKFIQILITNSATNKRIFYFDEIRIPDKIKPFICLGFDASGADAADDIFLDQTAPFLRANNIPSYFTVTNIYERLNSSGQGHERRQTLYDDFGWEAINHTWSHGASAVGVNWPSGNTLVVSGTGTLATLTLSSAHGVTVGAKMLIAVWGGTGASAAGALGVFEATATTTTAVTYTISGGADGAATGTTQASTYLGAVFNAATWTNQPIVLAEANALPALKHEILGIQGFSRSCGWLNGSSAHVYPNNSYPDMDWMQTVAALAGVKIARAGVGTTCRVSSDFGIDNPLVIGSFEMNGEVNGATIQHATDALQGAINRGEGLFIFGHNLRDETLDVGVDIDYPPGNNGNPSAPGTVPSLWWYEGQLEKFLTDVAIPLRDAGSLDFLSMEDVVDTFCR